MSLPASLRRWLKEVSWVLGLVVGLWYVWGLFNNFLDLVSVGDRVVEAEQEVVKLEQENQSLKSEVDSLESGKLDEFLIREELGLVKPGEKVVMIEESLLEEAVQEELVEKEEEVEVPVWKKWWNLLWYGERGR